MQIIKLGALQILIRDLNRELGLKSFIQTYIDCLKLRLYK